MVTGGCEEDDLTYFKAKCFLAPFHAAVRRGEGGETARAWPERAAHCG